MYYRILCIEERAWGIWQSVSVQGMRRILGENRNKASSLEMSMINVGTMLERSRGNCEDAN